jgi:hypothetical protein
MTMLLTEILVAQQVLIYFTSFANPGNLRHTRSCPCLIPKSLAGHRLGRSELSWKLLLRVGEITVNFCFI